ncbi:type II secretion system protein GspL [Maricaulis sp.]|uniref:type II secretion system protein GspL n=1 Tax=Maricaulis sp. TaxID=1486257 RepID=UPI0025BA5E4E|nr:type II secretion system protein GspL [Maricaulis sp.]
MSCDLILKPGPLGAVAWSVVDRRDGKRVHEGRLAADESLDGALTGSVDRTLILLPGEHVHLARLAIPARSEREARQAAPFLVEDEIASRLAETTVLPGPRGGDERRWIAAVDSALLMQWRDRLVPLAIRPAHVIPDSLVAAEPGAALTLYDRGDAVLFAHDPDSDSGSGAGPVAGVMDTALFGSVIQPLVKAAGSGEIAVSRSLGLTGANFRAIGQGGIDMRASAVPAERLATLPRLLGDALVSTFDGAALIRPLRRPAMMAAGLLLAFCLLIGGETAYFRLQADRFEAATIDQFNHAIPDFGRPVIAAEAERFLADRVARLEGTGPSVFLQLLAALDELTAESERVRVDHVRFDPARGALSVGATYTDFSDFDALSARAERLGLRLEDGGAREGTSGIEGEFVVRLP